MLQKEDEKKKTTLMANLEASYADGDSLWSLQQHGYVPKALSTHLMVVRACGFMWYVEDVVVEGQISSGKMYVWLI